MPNHACFDGADHSVYAHSREPHGYAAMAYLAGDDVNFACLDYQIEARVCQLAGVGLVFVTFTNYSRADEMQFSEYKTNLNL